MQKKCKECLQKLRIASKAAAGEMWQVPPMSDCTTDLLEAAQFELFECLEETIRAFDLDCELSLRRHANDADNLIRLVSDCRIGEAEDSALMLECLAGYIRIKSYTTGDHGDVMPGLLQSVIEASPTP